MTPNWYVLYVKTRNELKIAKHLEAQGIQVYCPVRVESRKWSDRIKKVKVPLLPSMLLVYITEANRPHVFEIPGTLRYLFWSGKPAIVPQGEIELLKEYLNDNDIINHEIEARAPGDVMPLDGYGFKDTEGIIEKVSNNVCWVRINSLGFVLKLYISGNKTEATKQ